MIESDLSTTLAETTTTVRSAVVTQRQAPKIHRRRKLCRMAHSTIVDVQLCLRDFCVAEVSRIRRNCEGYSGAVC